MQHMILLCHSIKFNSRCQRDIPDTDRFKIYIKSRKLGIFLTNLKDIKEWDDLVVVSRRRKRRKEKDIEENHFCVVFLYDTYDSVKNGRLLQSIVFFRPNSTTADDTWHFCKTIFLESLSSINSRRSYNTSLDIFTFLNF